MKINSRKVEDLNSTVEKMCREFLEKCANDEYLLKNGYTIIITSTFRNAEAQDDLYAQGRTKPGLRVTNAKSGFSWHNFRCAFDFAPCKKVGDKTVIPWHDNKLFEHVGNIGKTCGLEWGGDWKTFKDIPHLQYTGGLTLPQLRAKYGNQSPRKE